MDFKKTLHVKLNKIRDARCFPFIVFITENLLFSVYMCAHMSHPVHTWRRSEFVGAGVFLSRVGLRNHSVASDFTHRAVSAFFFSFFFFRD